VEKLEESLVFGGKRIQDIGRTLNQSEKMDDAISFRLQHIQCSQLLHKLK